MPCSYNIIDVLKARLPHRDVAGVISPDVVALASEILNTMADVTPTSRSCAPIIFTNDSDHSENLPQLSFQEYVNSIFESELQHQSKRRRKYFLYNLRQHLLPVIGSHPLAEITTPMIQQNIVQKMLDAGLQPQTARHAHSTASLIFKHARKTGHLAGPPPTLGVRFPKVVPQRRSALTLAQAQAVLRQIPEPYRTMAFMSLTTSMSFSELSALRWKRINLTDNPIPTDGENIPPACAAIREVLDGGELFGPGTPHQRRYVVLPTVLVTSLAERRARSKFNDQADFVFASRDGHPFWIRWANTKLKPAGVAVGAPWLSWSCFRNTYAVISEQLGLTFAERRAQLGLAPKRMLERYPNIEHDIRRRGVELMAAALLLESPESAAGGLIHV